MLLGHDIAIKNWLILSLVALIHLDKILIARLLRNCFSSTYCVVNVITTS